MKTSKFAIGTKVKGDGIIIRVITQSTGYVEVAYSTGKVKKEMACNLTDLEGNSLKSKVKKSNKVSASVLIEKESIRMAVLQDNFLDSQIKSGNYNINLIK